MYPRYLLAIDIGTGSLRCLLADLKGQVVSLRYKDWSYYTPPEIAPLGKEFDPDALWQTICQAVREAIQEAGISAKDIVGVSATSQREGAVFLDRGGREVYAGPNIDLRALAEGISLDSEKGEEIYSITGHRPSLLFVPAKLKWFEKNRPETFREIATVLPLSDWVIFKLCGRRVSEVCGMSELGLMDIRERTWSFSLELPPGICPKLGSAGERVGEVAPQAAAETGIPEGTPVALGAPDTQCGLMAMGIKEKGQTGIVAGWSAPVQMVTDEPLFDPEGRTWTGCYPLPRKWTLESSAGEAGNAYRWLKEIIFSQRDSSEEEVYKLMDDLAQQAPPGAEGVLAFLGPWAMDMRHLALKLGGFLFPLPLSFAHIQKSHLVRAALENLAFAIKANCLQLEAISGRKIEEVRMGGGLAQSLCLTRILPAVLDRPVLVPEIIEVSALGSLICAAVGAGVYSNLEEAMSAMKPQARVREPDRRAALEYAEYYQRWASTAEGLGKLGQEIQ